MRLPLTLCTVTLLGASIALWAQKMPELSADQPISIARDGSELVATGHAQLTQDKFFLEADEIHFDKTAGGGTADGHVQVGASSFRLIAPHVGYRLEEKDLVGDNFRLALSPLFMEGQYLQGNADSLSFEKATAYWQEPDCFSPNIKCRKITYNSEEESITVKHAVFRIGKVPFFYLPYLRARTFERPFSLDAKVGYRKDLGGYARTTTLFTLLPGFQAGALLDYYAKRGLMVGPALRSNVQQKGFSAVGELDSGFMNDTGDRGLDSENQPIGKSRRFVHVREKIKALDAVTVTAKIDYLSDSYVTRDFRPDYFRNNQEPDNFIEGTYKDNRYYLTIFTRPRPNTFQHYVERLPEVSFNWIPAQIGQSGIYQQFNAALAHLQKTPLLNQGEKTSVTRFDTYYGLFCPFSPKGGWLTVTPVIGARLTHYQDIHGATLAQQGGDYTRVLGQIGADVVLKSHGLWDVSNARWGIDGLRHNLTPLVQYRYIPHANQGQDRLPKLDDNLFSPYPQSIDLGERRDVDHMVGTNVLRFGLQNVLETRSPNYGSRSLASLDLYQDVRFNPEPYDRMFSDFYTELGLFPWDWLNIRLFSRIDPERMTLKEINTGFQIIDGKRWQVSLGTAFLQNQANQYWASGSFTFNERNRIKVTVRYDIRRSAFTEQSYSYWLRLGNAWILEPYLTRLEGATREKGWEVGMKVALVDL